VAASNETGSQGDNTDSTSFDVDCTVNLALTKSSDVEGSAAPGDSASFTIVVSNTGNATAHDVTVTDSVPSGLTIVDATFTGGSNGPDSCDVSGQDVSCDIGDLGAGASASVTIDVAATEDACPSITNTATVAASNETGGTGDNSASTSFDVTCVVNLALQKSASVTEIRSGKSFTYTITASNTGDATAANVHVTDSMPAGVTIDSATFTGGSNGSGSCDVSGSDVDCDLGSLAAGATATVTLNVSVDDAACPSVTNNATVSADNETGGTDDNSDSVDVGVTCVLASTVTPPPPPSTTTPPGGTAFTGSTVLPLGMVALILLVLGTGLLYLGRRREEDAEA
jgi:uncharacterized repeat protein (TIGR01451 family)